MSVRERAADPVTALLGNRFAFEEMARALATVADDGWLDLKDERREGYRELARHLTNEIEIVRGAVQEAITNIDDDYERDSLTNALLDVLLLLDDIDWGGGYRIREKAV